MTSGVLLLWGSSELAAQTNYQVIANLTDLGLNTALGGLVRGADGALYGTTAGGGATACGAIYRLVKAPSSGAFNGNFSTAGRTLSGAVAPGTYNLRLTSVNACGSATTAVQAVSVP